MEYKIPKSTIRSFINVLKDMKMNLEAIRKETLKDKRKVEVDFLISENKDKKVEQDDKIKFQLYSLVLDIINRLEMTIDKLIVSYERGNLEEYIPLFDVIIAGLGTQNDFVIMIILDVIKHNAKFNKDKYNESLEKIMTSLVSDYQIKGSDTLTKEENTRKFLEAYRKYLEKGYQIIAYLNGSADSAKNIEKQVEKACLIVMTYILKKLQKRRNMFLIIHQFLLKITRLNIILTVVRSCTCVTQKNLMKY